MLALTNARGNIWSNDCLRGLTMNTAVYATTRLILFGFGWIVAAGLAMLAEMMASGLAWPVFGFCAGWWTFACAVYVQGEANRSGARQA